MQSSACAELCLCKALTARTPARRRVQVGLCKTCGVFFETSASRAPLGTSARRPIKVPIEMPIEVLLAFVLPLKMCFSYLPPFLGFPRRWPWKSSGTIIKQPSVFVVRFRWVVYRIVQTFIPRRETRNSASSICPPLTCATSMYSTYIRTCPAIFWLRQALAEGFGSCGGLRRRNVKI